MSQLNTTSGANSSTAQGVQGAASASGAQSAKIECPKCREVISITQALGAEIEQKFEREFRARMLSTRQEMEGKLATARQELEGRMVAARQELERKLREELANKSRMEFEDLKAQVEEKAKRLEEAQRK